MKSNEFIKEHIKLDNREKISRKLSDLSKKYKEFSNYIDLIQKEAVAILFIYLLKEDFLFYSMVKDDIPRHKFRYYINILLAFNFIKYKKPSDNFLNEVSKIYNEHIAEVNTYYELTKKGKDFLNIKYIKDYLKIEYNNFIRGNFN